MTSLLGARKRAEEFATAIDPSDPRSTTAAPELAELVELVGTLRTAEPPQLRPDFSTALRAQLVAEAERSLAEDATLALRPRRRGARERRLALLASSVVLVGGSAGMAVAAQGSLPGDALYPIKRGLEKAQTDLSRSDAAKGHDLLDQARSRLTEVEGIVATPAEPQVPDTISDFRDQALRGSELLIAAYEESPQDEQLVADVRSFAGKALGTLQSVAADASPEHQDDLADAAAALLTIDQLATTACPTCAESGPALELPQPFLVAEEANRALERAQDTGGPTLENNHPPLPGGSGKAPDAGGEEPKNGGTQSPDSDGTTSQDGGTTDQEPGGTDDGGGLLPDTDGKGGGVLDGGVLDGGGKKSGGLLGPVNDATKQLLDEGLNPLLDSLLP